MSHPGERMEDVEALGSGESCGPLTPDDMVALRAAVGHFGKLDHDQRIDLPLAEQVRLLMEWACSRRPTDFRRSVPVDPLDHDVLLTHALGKLVALVTEHGA